MTINAAIATYYVAITLMHLPNKYVMPGEKKYFQEK